MLNRIIIMGRLTRDPELRRTQSGVPVTSFTLAVDRDFKSQSGERETDFINCVAWRNTAEFVAKYFAKGRMAIVEGRLQIRDWIDQDGGKRKSAEVVADNVRFGETKRDAYGDSGADYGGYGGGYGGGSGYGNNGGYGGGGSGYGNNGAYGGGSGYGSASAPASNYSNSAAPASGYASGAASASGYSNGTPPASGYASSPAPASGYSNGAAPASGYGNPPPPAPGYSNGTAPAPGYSSPPPAASASEFSEISEEDGDLPF